MIVDDPSKCASWATPGGILDQIATAIVQFWKSKNRLPLDEECEQANCLVQLIKCLHILRVVPTVFALSSTTIFSIKGCDISILGHMCRDYIHKTATGPPKGIWKRNLHTLGDSHMELFKIA